MEKVLFNDTDNGFKVIVNEVYENKPIIVIFPGGSYTHLSTREAIPVSNKFIELGYNTAIVYYSVAPFADYIQEKQANLAKKLAIIEQMKELADSPEDANKAYHEFKKLQAEWTEIKNIPADKTNELWKSYQLQTEKFYDLLKLNNEFREYDFKKNLGIKIQLCE